MTDAKAITSETIVTGLEFKDFYQNFWPEGWFVEDMYIPFENDIGKFTLEPDAKHQLGEFGWARWCGKGEPESGDRARPIWELYAQAMGKQSDEVLVAFRIDPKSAKKLVEMAESLGARHI